MIVCRICHKEKKEDEFSARIGSLTGYRTECKPCLSLLAKKRYETNRVSVIEKVKEYALAHKEKRAADNKAWRTKNHVLVKEYSQRPEVKAAKLERQKAYYQKNKEKVKKYIHGWNDRNKDKRREVKREYEASRYQNDPIYIIRKRLRARQNAILKSKGVYQQGKKVADFIGCTLPELKRHIESLFEIGMSWENKSLWHLDHIVPVVSFDLTNENQIKECFSFRNLRPLWAEENRQKGAKTVPKRKAK